MSRMTSSNSSLYSALVVADQVYPNGSHQPIVLVPGKYEGDIDSLKLDRARIIEKKESLSDADKYLTQHLRDLQLVTTLDMEDPHPEDFNVTKQYLLK